MLEVEVPPAPSRPDGASAVDELSVLLEQVLQRTQSTVRRVDVDDDQAARAPRAYGDVRSWPPRPPTTDGRFVSRRGAESSPDPRVLTRRAAIRMPACAHSGRMADCGVTREDGPAPAGVDD